MVNFQLSRDEHGGDNWGLFYSLFGWFAPYMSMIVPVIMIALLIVCCAPIFVSCFQSFIAHRLKAIMDPSLLIMQTTEEQYYLY